MKILYRSVLVAFMCIIQFVGFAQMTIDTFIPIEKNENINSKRNILKTNILAPLSICYERAISKRFSAAATLLYFPPFHTGDPEAKFGYIDLYNGTNGIMGELKYYFPSEKGLLSGFNAGLFAIYRVIDTRVRKIIYHTTDNSVSKIDATILIPAEYRSYGMLAGWQKIGKNGFTFSVNGGVGYYRLSNIPDIYPVNNETELGRLLNRYKGFAPRLAFSVGYAF
jgi:hypothetical protein